MKGRETRRVYREQVRRDSLCGYRMGEDSCLQVPGGGGGGGGGGRAVWTREEKRGRDQGIVRRLGWKKSRESLTW